MSVRILEVLSCNVLVHTIKLDNTEMRRKKKHFFFIISEKSVNIFRASSMIPRIELLDWIVEVD